MDGALIGLCMLVVGPRLGWMAVEGARHDDCWWWWLSDGRAGGKEESSSSSQQLYIVEEDVKKLKIKIDT